MRDSGVFHYQNGDNGYAEDNDIYIDRDWDELGKDQNNLKKSIAYAREQGISLAREKNLQDLLKRFVDFLACVSKQTHLPL